MKVLYRQDAGRASSARSDLGLQFCCQGEGGLADERRRLQFENLGGRIDYLLFFLRYTQASDMASHRLKAVVLLDHKT
jgi:hypothetical protein